MRLFTRVLTLAALVLTFAPAGATTHHVRNVDVGLVSAARTTAQTPTLPPMAPTLSVFPNPGHGQIAVQLAAPHGHDYKFRLSNVLGREVRLLALRPELTVEALPLDVSNLPAGLYFYSLLVNDKVVSTNRLTLQ